MGLFECSKNHYFPLQVEQNKVSDHLREQRPYFKTVFLQPLLLLLIMHYVYLVTVALEELLGSSPFP